MDKPESSYFTTSKNIYFGVKHSTQNLRLIGLLLENIEIGVLKLLEKQNLSIIKINFPIVPQIQEPIGVW